MKKAVCPYCDDPMPVVGRISVASREFAVGRCEGCDTVSGFATNPPATEPAFDVDWDSIEQTWSRFGKVEDGLPKPVITARLAELLVQKQKFAIPEWERVLVDEGIATQEQVREAARREDPVTYLITLGCAHEPMVRALAAWWDVPFTWFVTDRVDYALIKAHGSQDWWKKRNIVPVTPSGDKIRIAMPDPSRTDLLQEASQILGRPVTPVFALAGVLQGLLDQYE